MSVNVAIFQKIVVLLFQYNSFQFTSINLSKYVKNNGLSRKKFISEEN